MNGSGGSFPPSSHGPSPSRPASLAIERGSLAPYAPRRSPCVRLLHPWLDLLDHPLSVIEVRIHIGHRRNGHRAHRDTQLFEPTQPVHDLLQTHARPRVRVFDDRMTLADPRGAQAIRHFERPTLVG